MIPIVKHTHHDCYVRADCSTLIDLDRISFLEPPRILSLGRDLYHRPFFPTGDLWDFGCDTWELVREPENLPSRANAYVIGAYIKKGLEMFNRSHKFAVSFVHYDEPHLALIG